MTKIGLISDTHSFLDDAVFKHFEQCDEIWHAGDFGNIGLSDKLADFKPLRGVFGNIDGQDVRLVHPLDQRFKCEDVNVWMTHIGGYPDRYDVRVKAEIYTNPPQLFISGHSHILKVRTLMRFAIDGAKIQDLQVIELGAK